MSFQEIGLCIVYNQKGEQFVQINCYGCEVVCSNVDEYFRVNDVVEWNEYGVGNCVSWGESNVFFVYYDFMVDLEFMFQVVVCNGMSVMCFYS